MRHAKPPFGSSRAQPWSPRARPKKVPLQVVVPSRPPGREGRARFGAGEGAGKITGNWRRERGQADPLLARLKTAPPLVPPCPLHTHTLRSLPKTLSSQKQQPAKMAMIMKKAMGARVVRRVWISFFGGGPWLSLALPLFPPLLFPSRPPNISSARREAKDQPPISARLAPGPARRSPAHLSGASPGAWRGRGRRARDPPSSISRQVSLKNSLSSPSPALPPSPPTPNQRQATRKTVAAKAEFYGPNRGTFLVSFGASDCTARAAGSLFGCLLSLSFALSSVLAHPLSRTRPPHPLSGLSPKSDHRAPSRRAPPLRT